MRILVIGEWRFEIYEEAISNAFSSLGHEVHGFSWKEYFDTPSPGSVLNRFQNKYLFGPLIQRINWDLVREATRLKPDLIFLFRGTHITAHALREIKRRLPKALFVGYNNDDPFSPKTPSYLWRHFIASVPLLDITLAYRHHNIPQYKRLGARRVNLFRSWYIPANVPAAKQTEEWDVSFIGHYEPDGRLELLEKIVRNGFRLQLMGTGWDRVIARSRELAPLAPVRPVRGTAYYEALGRSKISLCFLSKINRDTYTRRCFEIPAVKKMMLAEYSSDLASLYQEQIEAEFFRNEDELIQKLTYYIQNDDARSRIAYAGHQRVIQDGHDVVSRVRQLFEFIQA
ncbi:hypothetical protein D3C72_128880 [compost metagenome]